MNYMEMSLKQLREYATFEEIRKILLNEEIKELEEQIKRNEQYREEDFEELKEAINDEDIKQLTISIRVRSKILLQDSKRLQRLQDII